MELLEKQKVGLYQDALKAVESAKCHRIEKKEIKLIDFIQIQVGDMEMLL